MGENTRIEWADHTFNPWWGCTRISPGCDHCYAAALAHRLGDGHLWQGGRRRTLGKNWDQPLAWDRKAEREGRRARVFCASMADVFDNQVDEAWRSDLWNLIRRTPNLDWLLLTKRPQNIAKMLPRPADNCLPDWGAGWPNVWLGTTVENQAEADRRIPQLLAVPAAKRFLSCEPLLGPVDLDGWLPGGNSCQSCDDGEGYGNRCSRTDIPRHEQCPWNRAVQKVVEHGPFDKDGFPASITSHAVTIDWVICGGESGPQARPILPVWVRSLRDQCAAAGAPFFFKQWGQFLPGEEVLDAAGNFAHVAFPDGDENCLPGDGWDIVYSSCLDHRGEPKRIWRDIWASGEGSMLRHVGKKAAGRRLDGVQHDGRPT